MIPKSKLAKYRSIMPGLPTAINETVKRLAAVSGSDLPSVQVLVFEPELGHSIWSDLRHHKRSMKSLEKMLRKGIKDLEWNGFRYITIHGTNYGLSDHNSD